MELNLTMDNDSGYDNHEPNLDFSSGSNSKMFSSQDIYICEDALQEKPTLTNCLACRTESFDSVINTSQESLGTEFSGFNDSFPSDSSFIIPKAKALVVHHNDLDSTVSENESFSVPSSNLSESNSSFISPSKRYKSPLKVITNFPPNSSQYTLPLPKRNLFNVDKNKENICPVTTPKKIISRTITGNLSPDLFSDEECTRAPTPVKKSPIKFKENILYNDVKLLKRVQSYLTGVHPPPCLTSYQITATEILEKIEQNRNLFWDSVDGTQKRDNCLIINTRFEECNKKWPSILDLRYHGLHHNRGKVSEDFEHLCGKYAERYISTETQSTCTVFDTNSQSSQKRKFNKPRWTAKSPGRRLSHLARRRITFSSSSLQTGSSSAILGSRTRQILVDAKKVSTFRKSPRKTPSKSPFKTRKNTPSSSAKKKLALRFREMSGEFEASTSSFNSSLQNIKRSLFTSPKQNKSLNVSTGSLEKRSTKRALFLSPHKNSPKKSPSTILDRKRKRNDTDEENPSKRMDIKKPEQKVNQSDLSTRPPSRLEELSEGHKKKLQWAVYESLRLQNISSTHPQYKMFASVLARVTRRLLPNLRLERGTTEKMFRIARHHSYAVVKGKTVDEIVNEYLKNKLKNQKPHGYVGPDQYNKKPEDKENVSSKVNSASLEGVGVKPRFLSSNRVEKIKKVISFEEKFN